ncbi:MAG: hypothetical protein FWC49_03745 [Proteobacteria bacterium]|nr:hypothetical protein [Pseudomonadota bacterium]
MGKRWSFVRILGLAAGLLVLILGAIGALVALLGDTDGQVRTGLRREAPAVRQLDRSSLREEPGGGKH